MQHHHLILGHAIRLADFEMLDDIQKRLYKLDIQIEGRAVKESTNLYNDRKRGKDASADHGSNRGIIFELWSHRSSSGIFCFSFSFLKLANYFIPMIDYAIDQIRAWVNPPDFDTALIRARKLQEDGTTAWLLGNAIFEQWKTPCEDVMQQAVSAQSCFSENTFWLHGAYARHTEFDSMLCSNGQH